MTPLTWSFADSRISKHVRPERTIGIHTYVACAVKRGDYEISTYYSPSAFSQ